MAAAAANVIRMWIPFMRSNGPPWTIGDIFAMVGQIRVIETPFGEWTWQIEDGRLTADPRRAEFLVQPA